MNKKEATRRQSKEEVQRRQAWEENEMMSQDLKETECDVISEKRPEKRQSSPKRQKPARSKNPMIDTEL